MKKKVSLLLAGLIFTFTAPVFANGTCNCCKECVEKCATSDSCSCNCTSCACDHKK